MPQESAGLKIAVIGTGYVGLVVGTCLADSGHDVVCVDNEPSKIETLRAGRAPIYEPGLEELLRRNQSEGRLQFTTDLADAVAPSLVVFIAVGTPATDNGEPDLSSVMAVARDIGDAMNSYKVIVEKSTVPVGTARKLRQVIAERTDFEFDIVSNPEFLKEGRAIEDFTKPDRIVVGADDVRVAEIMKELYAPFLRTENPILIMDVPSAEMTKLAANAMLAARISFMNEIANLCEAVGADVDSVRRGIGSDTRIGHSFLFPGVGYGGSCFPKDVQALAAVGRKRGVRMRMAESIHEVNEHQKRYLVKKVTAHFGDQLAGMRFAVWGLAFKPLTDDIREAPAVVIIEELLATGATITAYDPEAMPNARNVLGDRIAYAKGNYEALKDADALIVVTEWNEFRQPDFEKMRSLMRRPVVFDGRNIYKSETLRRYGFTHIAIGRPDSIGAETPSTGRG